MPPMPNIYSKELPATAAVNNNLSFPVKLDSLSKAKSLKTKNYTNHLGIVRPKIIDFSFT